MSIEILLLTAPLFALALLLLRDLPVLFIFAVLLFIRLFVDGPFNASLGGFQLSAILGMLILALAIASALRGWRGAFGFVVVGGLLYLSSLAAQSVDPRSLEEYIRLMSVIGVFVIVANLRKVPTPRSVVLIVQMTAIISAIFSIVQFGTGGGLVVDGVLRATGTMAHPNSAALLYAIGIAVSLISYIELKKRRVDVAVALFLFVALLSTGSVGGIVTLASMLAAYAFLSSRVSGRARVGILLVGLLGVVSFLLSPLGSERLAEFANLDLSGSSGERNSLEWRIGRWQDILAFWHQFPATGVGYGSSAGGALLNGYPPHNEYVRLLVETGFVGALIALVLFVVTLRALRRATKSESQAAILSTLALAVLLGMMVSALTENTFLYSVPGYLLALIIGSALRSASLSAPGGVIASRRRFTERNLHNA